MVKCRSCGMENCILILSLGHTPLANALVKEEDLQKQEPTYPLELVYCPDCTLVQITETVPPEQLFSEYLYFSSFSDTMLKHAQQISQKLIQDCHLTENSLVVEIASNDGYLLQYYQQAGIPVLGIEPAQNIAKVAQDKHGIPTICEFFDDNVARRLVSEGKQADVIHANNVIAHVAQLNSVVAGIATLLKPDGIAVIETPYVKNLIEDCEFDTIYHEHLCYYSLTALDHLFKKYGLVIYNVEQLDIHGGSLRIFASSHKQRSQFVQDVLRQEATWDLTFYQEFANRVEHIKRELLLVLNNLKQQHKNIAVYGASAKGSTLLNYFGLGVDTLDFVVDRSVYKQGYYTPGTHLKIYPPEKLLEALPDYVLLLTWNFADEILSQQESYRQRGGKFIIPIPQVKII